MTAQIFWLKTRARWKEVPAEFKHSGAVASFDISTIPREELDHLHASFALFSDRDREILGLSRSRHAHLARGATSSRRRIHREPNSNWPRFNCRARLIFSIRSSTRVLFDRFNSTAGNFDVAVSRMEFQLFRIGPPVAVSGVELPIIPNRPGGNKYGHSIKLMRTYSNSAVTDRRRARRISFPLACRLNFSIRCSTSCLSTDLIRPLQFGGGGIPDGIAIIPNRSGRQKMRTR